MCFFFVFFFFFFFFFFFSTVRSKAVFLLQLFFVCGSVVLYVAFVLSLFVLHLFFVWYHGKAVLRDCGISCISSLPVVLIQ